MKTKYTEENPVVMLVNPIAKGITLCFYNDVGKFVNDFLRRMHKSYGPMPDGGSITLSIKRAHDEDIENFEETMGVAVPTFEEAVKLAEMAGEE